MKLAKSDPRVVYMPAKDGPFRCGGCVFFRAPEACTEVAGDIYPDDCCNLYQKTLAKGVAPHRPVSASSVDRVRIYVYNARGELLALRRKKPDDENNNPAGTWEMIQGKLEPGESSEQAALRELWEEVAYQRSNLATWRALTPWVWEAVLLPGTRKPRIQDNPDEEHDYFVWRDEKLALQWMGRRIAKQAPADDIDALLRAVAWDDWDALTRAIAPELGEAASEGVVQGMAEVSTEDDDAFRLASADAIGYAEARAGELVTNIVPTTQDGLRRLVAKALTDGWSGDQLAQAITDSDLFSVDRADRIARTELATAMTQGNVLAWQRSGVVRGKRWLMSNLHDQDDECDENQSAGVIAMDDVFPSGDDGPPAHPNCACVLLPVLQDDSGA